jgi:hypothetical protein
MPNSSQRDRQDGEDFDYRGISERMQDSVVSIKPELTKSQYRLFTDHLQMKKASGRSTSRQSQQSATKKA